jgi:hypothetical protein
VALSFFGVFPLRPKNTARVKETNQILTQKEMPPKYCIWLCDDHKLSSLFPSYLFKAFHIQAQYTTQLHEANLIFGGRNLLRVPEHFSGTVFGAGLDRKIIRSFPLMKTINLLGHKSSECVLSANALNQSIMGDPLLLADIVYTRLQQKPGVVLNSGSAPSLLFLQTAEDVEICRQWKWVQNAEEAKELVVQDVMHIHQSMLEILELIAVSKHVFSNDPDVIAIALSFNVPCSPVTLKAADLFVWKDLYSAFPQQQAPTLKRLKDDTSLKEAISWCQTRAVGELKVLKANLVHQVEKLRGGVGSASASPMPVASKPKRRDRSPSIAAKPAASRRSKSMSRLSQTQVFNPVSAAPSRKSADELSTRLHPTWVKPVKSILSNSNSTPSPSSAAPSSSVSFSSLIASIPAKSSTPRTNPGLPPPLPAALLTEPSSSTSTPNIRNRNSRKIISAETPRLDD